MRVLVLGPNAKRLDPVLRKAGDSLFPLQDQLASDVFSAVAPDWIISYGYRYLLRPKVLALAPSRFINLHISYLPWNRGTHPNYWSWVEGTPKGVTIHEIDAGIDTGPIYAQRLVDLSENETFRATWERLMGALDDLFAEQWPLIRFGNTIPTAQDPAAGSFHYAREFELSSLRNGWETIIREHLAER